MSVGLNKLNTNSTDVCWLLQNLPENEQEIAGWHSLLTSYIAYQARIPNSISSNPMAVNRPLQ